MKSLERDIREMKEVYVKNREEWREWLCKNHNKEEKGIWLVFFKKKTKKPTLEYKHAVEEALCFGWIDSIIKKIDEEKYVRKFTPRDSKSLWSLSNKRRVTKMIKEGKMTRHGLAKINAAKKSGLWDKNDRPQINFDMPHELENALKKNRKARKFFEHLAPSYKKQFIGWIKIAKQKETKEKRLKETIEKLTNGEKLGLK
jgi:uncharacterized protein YdeI (YjbR/CyaY-like superfamily)